MTARALKLSGMALGKALSGLAKHEKLKRAIKNTRKAPPTSVDRAWPLMRHIAPLGRAPSRMTPQMIAAVGRTPSETRRRADSGTSSAGQRRPKRARTSRSEGINASDPMALLRAAVDADRDTHLPAALLSTHGPSLLVMGRRTSLSV